MNASAARPLLVTGMHRGGTSAMAGVAHLLGYDAGPALMPAVDGVNRKGFWEHLDAFGIHERLFAALGRSSFDPRGLPERWHSHPAYAIAVGEVRALIERDFLGSTHWVVKDARLCKLVPVWLDAMHQIGLEPRVLLIVRDPVEVVTSVQSLGWSPSPARSYLCWTQYMLDVEVATRGVARACVTYEELLTDWRTELARIARELQIEWPCYDEKSQDVDAFLDVRERHHIERADSPLDLARAAPRLAQRLYEAYRERGADGPWPRVSAIGGIYALAQGLFGASVDELIVELSLARWSLHERAREPELGNGS